VLAFFDRPGASNGPTEAINGRLEHLRGSALGFRNLTNRWATRPVCATLPTMSVHVTAAMAKGPRMCCRMCMAMCWCA
jgi:hypothetical protein